MRGMALEQRFAFEGKHSSLSTERENLSALHSCAALGRGGKSYEKDSNPVDAVPDAYLLLHFTSAL